MLHKTFHESVMVGTALLPTTISAATAVNGSTIALNFGGSAISFLFQTTGIATDEVATVKFEESADASAFTKVQSNDAAADLSFTVPNAVAGDEGTVLATIPFAKLLATTKYVRMVVTSAGGTISYTAAAQYVISGFQSHPTSQEDKTFAACVSFV
jgi:hypothetical protein